MNIIRNALSEIQLKYKISKAVSEATNNSKLHIRAGDADDVIALAMDHPQYVLQAIYDRLMYDGYVSATTFLGIELLEQVVNNSSYGFHVVLADYGHLRNRLVDLACVGGDNATCRAVRGAARRLVLEFSRMFADDDRLSMLSRLADRVEVQSGRKLLRSILLEKKRVHIRSPRDGDIVLIDPIERPEGQSPRLPPSPIWTCAPCGFVNKSKHLRCIVCGSMKPRPTASSSSIQVGSPVSSSPQQVVSSPTNPPPTASFESQIPPKPTAVTATSSEEEAGTELTSSNALSDTVDNGHQKTDASVTPKNNQRSGETSPSKSFEADTAQDNSGMSPEPGKLADNEEPNTMPTSSAYENEDDPEITEEDAVVEAIVERSQSKEPLRNSHYIDKNGVHRLVEAEDVEAIRATLHHNAEVQEQNSRRNSSSSLDNSAIHVDPYAGIEEEKADSGKQEVEKTDQQVATEANEVHEPNVNSDLRAVTVSIEESLEVEAPPKEEADVIDNQSVEQQVTSQGEDTLPETKVTDDKIGRFEESQIKSEDTVVDAEPSVPAVSVTDQMEASPDIVTDVNSQSEEPQFRSEDIEAESSVPSESVVDETLPEAAESPSDAQQQVINKGGKKNSKKKR